ncbi:unnamed protein product [Darwinula stevensoni]|uniref:C4H2-type domain-containing protein n=1 Tax=Darwinula stevensoni TaxID=69355 RepID=A0A7R8XHF9_9CRUS|nr:unnamed protein product [Darwinula stevensoni]CAG0890409.1 unnamed protein product [Darwinula stevensoni]
METVIKQAEASRESAYKSARCLLEEYRPLKTEIDRRRQELLGLSRLPDLNENERHISIESLEKIACAGEMGWGMGGLGPVGGHLDQGPPPAAHQQAAILSMFRPRPPSPASTNNPPSAPAPSPFRQQPPPMKACLSCHQQIHRNAPICPLCKAKSRSRNPKKPKRKESSTPLPPSQ